MTDTNKERAEFEAHYFAENGNRLYCESQWRGWKAHASLAAKAPAAPNQAEFALRALVAAGFVTQAKVDEAMTLPGAPPAAELTPVYLVNTGEIRNGLELYERHDRPVPLADYEMLYTAPPAPTEQWRDIETAPKDGIWQDGNNHYAEYILVWYPGALRPMRARWWFRDDSEACNFLADGGYAVFPTMYQPLPAPPQGAAKGANDAASS